jgi:GAF domain-containing protein
VIVNSEARLDLGERARPGGLACALSVPLIARESLVGTLTLYSTATFSDSQSRLVQIIAPHLAQAIWTARRDEASHASQNAQPANASTELRLVSAR